MFINNNARIKILGLRDARDPKPRSPTFLKNYPLGPDPKSLQKNSKNTKTYSNNTIIRVCFSGGGLVSAYLLAFLKGQIFWLFRGKRSEKGRTNTTKIGRAFLGAENALFPQFKAMFCLKARQKTRPWPFQYF